jgi:NADH dehydrogenase (ubiquinone) Fe-S protein 3
MLLFFKNLNLNNKKFEKNLSKKFYSILPVVFTQKLNNEIIYIIHKKNLVFILLCLKMHIKFQYKILSCISGVDFLETSINKIYRFSIVYDLLSIIYNTRIRIKIFLNEVSLISSITNVYINANWWEREVWDMYGIWFENHPDLRRILTDYGFDGFPLRKDFPLVGYFEVLYDLKKKRIISRPCEFSQEFRNFTFENSWV